MKTHTINRNKWIAIWTCLSISLLSVNMSLEAVVQKSGINSASGSFKIGWASVDITPDRPVIITGGSSARVSEGVRDHIFATALVIESAKEKGVSDMVIMVSLDLVGVSDILYERVQDRVKKSIPEIDINKIILNATHTHTAPEFRISPSLSNMQKKYNINLPLEWSRWGIDLGIMSPAEYVEFASDRIAMAITKAWKGKQPGGISFGLSYATVGQNRLTSYYDGKSIMGGDPGKPDFSHVEGYEDHSLGLLYTWDVGGKLTGVVINLAVTSQVSYGYLISADFWHETRNEIRRRLGENLFIMPQVSAAGDQSPAMYINDRAEKRMQQLTGRSQMEQIAVRIADGVISILPVMEKNIEYDPVLHHQVKQLNLQRRVITEKDLTTRRSTSHNPKVENVYESFDRLLGEYLKMYKEIEANPEIRQKPRWYSSITNVHWLLGRAWETLERYELQKTQYTLPVQVHVIRIGDMAIATNPFELYLDYGMQMKARSKAVQTFLVELCSPSYLGYLPTRRSVEGGAYGAIPQSTLIGPEGGRELVNQTLEMIESLWN